MRHRVRPRAHEGLLQKQSNILPNRVYQTFEKLEPAHWAMDSKTFTVGEKEGWELFIATSNMASALLIGTA
jgi:hypothetical protein